jgi:hypothetical protein
MRSFLPAFEGSPAGLVVPRPALAAWPLLALGLLPVGLGIAGAIPALGGLGLGAACVVGALVRAGRAWRQLSGLRELADQQLLRGARPGSSPLLLWRSDQLTGAGNRRVLARTLRGIVGELDRRLLPGASPVNRVAARPYLGVIRALAARMGELERPVSPEGVLLVERLLTEGWGPLYSHARAQELGAALVRCLAGLETESDAEGAFVLDCNGHAPRAQRKLVVGRGRMR